MPYIRGIKDFSQNDEIIDEQNIINMIEVTWSVEGIGQFKDYYVTDQSVEQFLSSNKNLKETTFENFFHKILVGDISDPLPGYTEETKHLAAIPVSVQSCKSIMTKQGARILSRENDLHLLREQKDTLNLDEEVGKLKKIVVTIDPNAPGYAVSVCYDSGNGLQGAWNLDKKTAEEAANLFRKSNTGTVVSQHEQIICTLPAVLEIQEKWPLGSYTEVHNEHDFCFAAAHFDGAKELISKLMLGANNLDIMCPLFVVCNGKEFFLNESKITNNKGIDREISDHDTYIELLKEIELLSSNKKNRGH